MNFLTVKDEFESINYENFQAKLAPFENYSIESDTGKENENLFKNDKTESLNSKKNELVELEDQNLAEITLPGYLIKLLRISSKMNFKKLLEEVSKIYDTLRKSDGTKYEADKTKAIKGSLTSSEMFINIGNNQWSLNDELAKIYETKTAQKIKKLIIKRNSNRKDKAIKRAERKMHAQNALAVMNDDDKNDDNLLESQHSLNPSKLEDPQVNKSRKRYRRKQEKYELIYNVLNGCTKALKQNNATIHLLKNPFKGFTGTETMDDIWKSIGPEKVIGILQCFEYFSPLLEEALIDKNKIHNRSNKATEKDLKNIIDGINMINKKINNIENEIKKNS